MATLKVFTFPPDWGLPTVGPFALKLLAWLELAGLPYEQVYEANPRKGPKGKNPWIELDGVRIGDSEVIIDLLKERHAVQMDQGPSSSLRDMPGGEPSRSTITKCSNGSCFSIQLGRPGCAQV
jgi:hypothetical protein